MDSFLNNNDRDYLRLKHGQEKEKRYADRIKAILLLDEGFSYGQVANWLMLDDDTIRDHYKQYESGGIDNLLRDAYKGRVSNLSAEQLKSLEQHLESQIYTEAKAIADYIESTYAVIYTCDGVRKLLHRIGFVYKKPKHVPSKANAEKQEEFIAKYEQLKGDKQPEDHILFMDGCHPMHNSQPAYGWIKKGTEKGLPSNNGRSRVNINGAYNIEKHEVVVRQDERINAQSTIALLEQLLERYPEGMMYIILDNARYYKCKLVTEFLENNKERITFVFLPPYSPNLNLIERLWGFFKSKTTHNKYYEKFAVFKHEAMAFFENMDQYRDELESLMTENFQRLPNMIHNTS
jgi:transposase